MFSFVGDVVVDPFSGTGTTSQAAALTGRHSIAFEVEPSYNLDARKRFAAFVKRLDGSSPPHTKGEKRRFRPLQPTVADATA